MTSSYFDDHRQDLLFLNADLYEEQQEAMRETDPSDWTGVVDAEPREDAFDEHLGILGRLNEV